MGTDEESLSSIAKVCNETKGYCSFTSKNMLNICKAQHLDSAAHSIESVIQEQSDFKVTTQVLNISQQFSYMLQNDMSKYSKIDLSKMKVDVLSECSLLKYTGKDMFFLSIVPSNSATILSLH